MKKVVLIPLANGFEEIEAVALIDILRRGEVEVIVASLDSELKVEGANKITVMADRTVSGIGVNDIDMIVLPGGWDGTHKLAEDENVQSLLKEMNRQNKNIGAICAAPFALKQAEILPKRYTCYPDANEQIKGDDYTDQKQVVTDGNIMTSRGPATAICFALEIVKRLVGDDVYQSIKSGILADYCG